MKQILKKAIAFLCVFSIMISSWTLIPATLVEASSLDGYTPITLSDFGVENGDYVYNTKTGIAFAKGLTSKENLYDKVLTFYATFHGAGNNIYYGMESVNDWTALQITIPKTDTEKLYVHNGDGSDPGWTNVATFSAGEAGVTNMLGSKLKISIAALKGDFNNNKTTNDLKIIVSVNDCEAKELIFEGGAANFADKFGVYAPTTGKISLESVQPGEAEASPEDLKKISWEDFGVAETNTYTTADVPTSLTSFGLVPLSLDAEHGLTSLIGTSFRGKISLQSGSDTSNFYIAYGDNIMNSHGIRIIPQSDGTLLFQAMNIANGWPYPTIAQVCPADVNLSSFTEGSAFELGIDIWEVSDPEDGKNDVKVNIFVNEVQCTFHAYVLEDAAVTNSGSTKFIGTNINLFRLGENDKITLEVTPGDEPAEPEESPADLIPITWSDFGITEKKNYTVKDVPESYKKFGLIPHRWDSDKTLHSLIGTSFRGTLSFQLGSENSNYFISYGDSGIDSFGIRIIPQKNGKLLLQAMDMQVGWPYVTIATLNPTKAGLVSFTDGSVFELGIDMWEAVDEEDHINDVKINIFINGTQYNKAAYIWENAVHNNSISTTKFLGNSMNIHLVKENDEIVILGEKPDYGTPIKPDASLKEISFSSFDVADGTYSYNKKDLAIQGGYYDPQRGKSLNGTLFHGYVNFDSEWGVQLRLGGKTSAWEGIILVSNGDGKLLLVDSKNNTWCVFTPTLAGVPLTDNLIDLKVSIVYVDSDKDGKKDDVQVGVWFDDVLYKNQFIYMTDYASSLGSMLGIYSPKTGVDLIVKSANVDNRIDFSLFGFDKDHDAYIARTGLAREVYLKSATGSRTLTAATSKGSPKTADTVRAGFYVILLAASSCAVVLSKKKRCRKGTEK